MATSSHLRSQRPTRPRRAPWALAIILGACGPNAPDEAPASSDRLPPLVVEATGCARFRLPNRCELAPGGELRLWVAWPDDAAPPEVTVDATPVAARAERLPAGEGLRLRVAAPPPGRVEVRAPGRAPGLGWLVRPPETPGIAVERAAALRRAGRLVEARRTLEDAVATDAGAPERVTGGQESTGRPITSEEARAEVLSALARLDRAEGANERAVSRLRAAIALYRAAGRALDVANDTAVLAYTLTYGLRRFAEARAALDALEPEAAVLADAAIVQRYYRSVIDHRSANLRGVVEGHEVLMRLTARLDFAERRLGAAQILALALLGVGRVREAAATLLPFRGVALADGGCGRVPLLNNLGWVALRAPGALGPPEPYLEAALVLAHGPCADRQGELEIGLDLALAALQRSDVPAAIQAVAAARRAFPEVQGQPAMNLLWVQATVDAAAGRRAAAAAGFTRLLALAEAAALPGLAWQAAVGAARLAASAPGPAARAEALAAYARAEALLVREAREVPMTEGRESLVSDREAATAEHLGLLHAAGRLDEAWLLMRTSRGRVLAALARADRLAALDAPGRARWEAALATWHRERATLDAEAARDWELPAVALHRARARREALRARLRATLDTALAALDVTDPAPDPAPPPPGMLRFSAHPLPDGAWLAGAQTSEGLELVKLTRLELPPTDAPGDRTTPLAAALLAPFTVRLAAAQRVAMLPAGRLRAVDFHALPVNGVPLGDGWVVVYPLDLGGPPAPPSPGPLRPPVVVGDPRGDLPAARVEAEAAAQALATRLGAVTVLGGPQATGVAVRAALRGAPFLHYAGHGRFSGAGGWTSALPLADASELTVVDILALRPAPTRVVLSGCETARQDLAGPAESLGLAQAFVLAGASEVLAAARPVDDAMAAVLSARAHAALAATPATEPFPLAAALRESVRELRRTPGDWSVFRVYVR